MRNFGTLARVTRRCILLCSLALLIACTSTVDSQVVDETWTDPGGAPLPRTRVSSFLGSFGCEDPEESNEKRPLLSVNDLIYEPSEMPIRSEPVGRAELYAVSSEGRKLYLDPANEDTVFLETGEGVQTWTYEEFGCD
jgi:hypothetical protein